MIYHAQLNQQIMTPLYTKIKNKTYAKKRKTCGRGIKDHPYPLCVHANPTVCACNRIKYLFNN